MLFFEKVYLSCRFIKNKFIREKTLLFENKVVTLPQIIKQ
jgi:hypothetical protein